MNAFVYLLIAVAVVAVPTPASAVVTFFSPDTATATNTNLAGTSPTNLINRSGLSSTPVTLDNIGTTLHLDALNLGNDGLKILWRGSAAALPITFTFDFNTSQRIGFVGLWQGYSVDQGVGNFDLTFWDGPSGTGNAIGSVYSDVLDTGAGGSIPLNGRAFDVGTRLGVESITMDILSIALPLNVHVHFGEFMVAAAPVPVPSSFALLVGALTLCGYAVSRNGRKEIGTGNFLIR